MTGQGPGTNRPIRWAIFVSGSGTNLQNVLDLEQSGDLKKNRVNAVFADRPCTAIERAHKFGKPTLVLEPKEADATDKLLQFLQDHQVNSIFLLGYMRILSVDFLRQWKGRIVNLHPSWLPNHRGLDAIQKAYDAGDKFFGVSIHEVISELDSGPIVRQISFPREPGLTIEGAIQKTHEFEYKLVKDYLLDLERE